MPATRADTDADSVVPPTPTEVVMLPPVDTPTPTPELTPTSTVSSNADGDTDTRNARNGQHVRFAAHRTLDRGEFKDAERRFSTIVEIEPDSSRALGPAAGRRV